MTVRIVLTCLLCHDRVAMDGPPPNTTQAFMCEDCTLKIMEVDLAMGDKQ